MMEFSSASKDVDQDESVDAFVKNLMGAVRAEQAPLITEVVCSGMSLASEKDWDAETTVSFLRSVVEIFVNAQSAFAHELAS